MENQNALITIIGRHGILDQRLWMSVMTYDDHLCNKSARKQQLLLGTVKQFPSTVFLSFTSLAIVYTVHAYLQPNLVLVVDNLSNVPLFVAQLFDTISMVSCQQEHALSHSQQDIQNLGPLPLLSTDLFESNHAPLKQIRTAKRTSKVRFFYELH